VALVANVAPGAFFVFVDVCRPESKLQVLEFALLRAALARAFATGDERRASDPFKRVAPSDRFVSGRPTIGE
jgi:hypothetical protein